MSSILKALQKLEQERAARRNGRPDITGAILRQRKAAKPLPAWLVPAGMSFVAFVAVLATYTAMGGFSAAKPTVTTSIPQQAIPPVTSSQPPAAPTPVSQTPVVPVSFGGSVVPPAVPSSKPRPTAQEPARLPPPSTPAATARPAVPPPTASAPRTAQAEKPATRPTTSPRADIPSLAVSGIAWHKDSTDRLAVINGMPASEGTTVDGVRVEEIFPDRVRFSFRNERFEVVLGKSSRGQ
jgi:general secretion pathway protein B